MGVNDSPSSYVLMQLCAKLFPADVRVRGGSDSMGARAERRFGMDSRADEQKMAILARKRRPS